MHLKREVIGSITKAKLQQVFHMRINYVMLRTPAGPSEMKPYCVHLMSTQPLASRSSLQAAAGWGGANRSGPTGGAAKGRPWKLR